MAERLPKVRRANSRQTVLAYVLVGVTVLLVAAVAALLLSDGLFTSEPQSDAERDYQVLLDGLKKNPKDPSVLMTLAEAEYDLGRESEAFDHAKSAISYARKQPGFRTRYASLLLRSDEVKIARKIVQEEIELKTSGDAEPYFLMAQIERELGDLKSAEKNIGEALKIAPTSVDFIVLRAQILEKQGRKADAIAGYEEALRYVPGFQEAIDGLQRLGVEPPASTETTAHGGDTAP